MNGSKNIIPNHTRGSQTCYKIRSADGELVAIHVRRDTPDGGKKMWWERPGGRRGLNGTKLADLPLYNSEHIADWPADWPLVLTEGEKPADALMQVGIKALGTVTGAASEPGDDALEVLLDREVILWPDADKAGRSHMERIARRLQGIAETVRWYEDPDAADGEDAADHPAIVSGGDRRQGMLLNDLLCAPEWKPPEPSANEHHPDKDIEVVCAAEVTLKAVRWFWRRRIPFGKLTIFDGDPDLGKSVVTVDIAARGTTGRTFPGGEPCEIGNVLIVNIEDAADDTVVPRLKAAGADLNRVYLFSSIPDGKGGTRLLSIPEDVPLLERLIVQRDIKLVIIDPILTMLSGDANKDQDARRALAPVRDMAERTSVAIVAVRHLNKSVGLKAIQRGGGNMGLIGVARAGAFFAEHPDEQGLKVMAPHKSNLAEKPPSLGYRIVGNIDGVPRIEWSGVVEHDANTLAANASTPHEKTQLDEAKEFLCDELKDTPMWVKQIYKDAKDAGISDRTLQRAKTTLRVRSEKMGVDGWMWSLPPEGSEDGQGKQVGDLGDLGDVQESDERSSANSLYIKEERQERQGRQDRQGCQEEDSLGDVPLGADEVVCIHETRGGCWLCRGEKA